MWLSSCSPFSFSGKVEYFRYRDNMRKLQDVISEKEMILDRLEAMSIFLAVIDEGSLARAARRLGRSPASVTRAVARLEAISGERLLERTTRRFAVSEA